MIAAIDIAALGGIWISSPCTTRRRCHQMYQQPVIKISDKPTVLNSVAKPPCHIISWIIIDPDLSTSNNFSILSHIPREIQTSFARLQEKRACLISSASDKHLGQLTPLMGICLFANVTKHCRHPWRAFHAKILILLGIESFHSWRQTGPILRFPGPGAKLSTGALLCEIVDY